MPLGGVLAGFLLPPVVEMFGWRMALLVAGVLVLAIILAVQPMRPSLDASRKRDLRLTLGALFAPSNILSSFAAVSASPSAVRRASAGACLAIGQGVDSPIS